MLVRFIRSSATLFALCALLASTPPKVAITPELQAMLDSVRPDQLRGDLSFLASDLLEGRNTPSRGLDIAAEYIASQFRGAGLEPGGDNGSYFQNARMIVARPDLAGFELSLTQGDRSVHVRAEDISSLV